jgi:hypothetical protein
MPEPVTPPPLAPVSVDLRLGDQYSVNEVMMRSLAVQLGVALEPATPTASVALGINLLVVNATVSVTRAHQALALDDPRLVRNVVDKLGKSGVLVPRRPATDEIVMYGRVLYVYEEIAAAVPVYLPVKGTALEGLPGAPESLCVWVADPPDDQIAPGWAPEFACWQGSFLFLVEAAYDTHHSGSTMSGVSALSILIDGLVDGHGARPEAVRSENLRIGRFTTGDVRHPVEIMEALGGRSGRPRPISTVYKVVYMSDEQSFLRNGRGLRIHDIMAYPLFVANH